MWCKSALQSRISRGFREQSRKSQGTMEHSEIFLVGNKETMETDTRVIFFSHASSFFPGNLCRYSY